MGRECRKIHEAKTREAKVSAKPVIPVLAPKTLPAATAAAVLPGKPVPVSLQRFSIHRTARPEPGLFDQLDQEQPKLHPILDLHRHEDGYVSFASKTDDDFRPKFAARPSDLEKWFPEFRDQLIKNSFVSINAAWKFGRPLERTAGAFGVPAHRTDTLRYLCACYSDLDFYKLGLTFGTVFGKVIDYQDQGKIPPASIIVRSGRGIWVIWLLRDPNNPDRAQPAFHEKIDLYLRVERAIAQVMSELAADAAATCAARYVRVPGSFHTGAEELVKWWPQLKGNGERYLYTLDELARHFGVPATMPRPIRKAFAECARPNKRSSGHKMLAFYRLRELRMLESHRGGFHEGCRGHAAFIYAKVLRSSRLSREDALREVAVMGRNCRPPLLVSKCADAVRGAFSGRRHTGIRDQTIADWLDVTPEECEMLPARDSGHGMPPASRYGDTGSMGPETPQSGKAPRQAAILKLVGELEFVPTNRAMAGFLSAAGFAANHVTVAADYTALGLETERIKQNRSLAELTQKQPSLFQ
jgi:hypothetical protein